MPRLRYIKLFERQIPVAHAVKRFGVHEHKGKSLRRVYRRLFDLGWPPEEALGLVPRGTKRNSPAWEEACQQFWQRIRPEGRY